MTMKIVTAKQYLSEKEQQASTQMTMKNIDESVLEIIKQVKQRGDKALFQYTRKFDAADLTDLLVSEEEFEEAEKAVSDEFRSALKQAKANITEFHQIQKEQSWFINKENGIMLGQKVTPIDKAGIYIPGGKAAYPSSVLMNAIPAKLAGVEKIMITTPPQANGKISPYVLIAAKEAEVDKVYKIGGAQAIAALAYGTKTIEKVSKIVGPGNAYVARAKKWVFGDVAIDMIAGPSEICIVADETAPPAYAAADLLSQAEHDESAKPICITTNSNLAERIKLEVEKQTARLERKEIIQRSLEQNGRIVLAENQLEAFELANDIAPEHLQLMVENPTEKLQYVKNAGAVFLGNHSPEALGDYFAGPNHTLPTSGTAKFSSPLGVYDFVKKSSIISYSSGALQEASNPIISLATMEGLTAHANSIQVRKEGSHAKLQD